MTIGDWIEKIASLFGVKPSAVRRCEKRIADADAKIKLIQENYNRIFKENNTLYEQIEGKKRMLAREVVPANKQMLQMQISVENKNFEQKTKLATFLMNQLTNLNVLRGSIELSLAQVRTGVSPITLELQLDEMDIILEDAEEANKLGQALDGKTISPVFTVEENPVANAAKGENLKAPIVRGEMQASPVLDPAVPSNEMNDKTDVVVPQV